MTRRSANIPFLGSAQAYADFFNNQTMQTPQNLEGESLPAGIQKSYLLETVYKPGGGAGQVDAILRGTRLKPEPVSNSEEAFRLVDASGNGLAVLETLDSRYWAIHTIAKSEVADRVIRDLVYHNPYLDHLWLSSHAFQSLWKAVLASNNPRRYTRITFEHESLFDADGVEADNDLEDERRASRFTMVDRIGVIERQMPVLSQTYAPLSSIVHLRVPSTAKGGHDVFFDGKVSNRSSTFTGHRRTLTAIIRMYSGLTAAVEDRLWLSGQESGALNASVAELIFDEELSEATFRRWIVNLFNNKRNRFRLSGYANWISPRKVQANALDQHLWQPLIMELTTKRVVAVLPEGTCGNTVNRLVSNIQRYVDPRVKVYVGDSEYSDLVPAFGGTQIA